MADYGGVSLATPAALPTVSVEIGSYALSTISFHYGSVLTATPSPLPTVAATNGTREIVMGTLTPRAYVFGTDQHWHAVT